MRTMYRLFRLKNGHPYTLFHGIEGSRKIELNHLYKARKVMARDGGTGTEYLTGFHVMETYQDCVDYMKQFNKTHDLTISEVQVFGELRLKAHSRAPVFLADSMLLSLSQWLNR